MAAFSRSKKFTLGEPIPLPAPTVAPPPVHLFLRLECFDKDKAGDPQDEAEPPRTLKPRKARATTSKATSSQPSTAAPSQAVPPPQNIQNISSGSSPTRSPAEVPISAIPETSVAPQQSSRSTEPTSQEEPLPTAADLALRSTSAGASGDSRAVTVADISQQLSLAMEANRTQLMEVLDRRERRWEEQRQADLEQIRKMREEDKAEMTKLREEDKAEQKRLRDEEKEERKKEKEREAKRRRKERLEDKKELVSYLAAAFKNLPIPGFGLPAPTPAAGTSAEPVVPPDSQSKSPAASSGSSGEDSSKSRDSAHQP